MGAVLEWGRLYLHNDYGFLNDIADSGVDELHQDVDASFGRLFDFDSTLSDRFDALPHKLDIHL